MKTVALVDIGNDGHREAYMRYFIGALLELDCRVLCLIPETGLVKNWVDQTYPVKKDRVFYREWHYLRDKFPYAGRLRERLNILNNWNTVSVSIREIEHQYQLKTDLVFFNFLDAFLINYTPTFILDAILGKKWGGIYFFPAFLRLEPDLLSEATRLSSRDYCMSAKNCVAVGIHDEGIRAKFSTRIGKPVMLFPEIADLSEPDRKDPFRLKILDLAKGRLIVGNIGLEKHKGNFELMRLAKVADPGKYFFVFCGRDDGTLYDFLSADETAELRAFIRQLPENCLWYPAVFREGPQFNAVIAAFDVVYMIYTHFYGASNRLTKAAYFQKLILADNKYCIGDTVKRYGLGEAIPDTEPATMLAALDRLCWRIEQKDLPVDNWAEFLSHNSQESLLERFREILELP